MAIIRSMYTDIPAHDVATVFMNTGSLRLARPSLGILGALRMGSENQNMPALFRFVRAMRRPGGPPTGRLRFSRHLPRDEYQHQKPGVEQMIENIRNPFLGPRSNGISWTRAQVECLT
jgi:hypothetical protein